jgi:photosystem II stability/assembly factor-like uncharacterized protein
MKKIITLIIVFISFVLNMFSYEWNIFQIHAHTYFFSIDSYDSLHYCIAGQYNTVNNGNATIYNFIGISTDAGNTWDIKWKSNIDIMNGIYDPRKIKKAVFLSKDVIVVGLEGGYIIRTSNLGMTWDTTDFNIDSSKDCNAFSFYDKKHGAAYFIGQSFICMSDDSGKTWYNKEKPFIEYYPNLSNKYHVDDIIRLNDSIMIMSCYNYVDDTHWIIRTENKGDTWEFNNESGNYIINMHFYNDKIGWMGGSKKLYVDYNSIIKKTTDGGKSWFVCYDGENPYSGVHMMHIFDEFNVIGVNNSEILRTTDGGNNWYTETYSEPYNFAFRDITFGNKNRGLILTRHFYILSNDPETGIITKSKSNDCFSVYPTPLMSSQSVKIKFITEKNSNINIDLINNLGVKLSDIYSGFKESGEHTVQFIPPNSLVSGVYWIKIIINEDKIISKPLIFVE